MNENNEKERIEKRNFGIWIFDLIIASVIFSAFLTFGFGIALQEEWSVKKKHFGGAIIIWLGFLFWEIYAMVHESDRDEKWEKQKLLNFTF